MELWQTYVEVVCFGCDVNAKRMILEKTKIDECGSIYNWAVGTRMVRTPEEVAGVLLEFDNLIISYIISFASYFA